MLTFSMCGCALLVGWYWCRYDESDCDFSLIDPSLDWSTTFLELTEVEWSYTKSSGPVPQVRHHFARSLHRFRETHTHEHTIAR